MTLTTDDKYLTFHRDEFLDWLRTPMSAMPLPVPDAIVIRRQDLFAGPALHAYASSISITARLLPHGVVRDSLMKVADYFHTQAVLADEEGWKVPD